MSLKKQVLQMVMLAVAGVFLAPDVCLGLKIGAFNIQVLGQRKIMNSEVVNTLVKIVRRYDVIYIQEIRDSGGKTVVPTLLREVNRGSEHAYQCEVSGNLGRSSQKERYAYFYRTDAIDVWGTYQFDDPNDLFEREPFSILISSKETEDTETDPWKFFLLGAHLKPTDVCSELGALGNAYRTTSQAFNGRSGFVLGDFNADCTYLRGCAFRDLEIVQSPFAKWLIDSSMDTTTTPNYCAYDRIIALGDTRDHIVPYSAGVYRFDRDLSLSPEKVKGVSDHYPVEVEINNRARCLTNLIIVVVLSTHSQAHSKGPHIVRITTQNENGTYTLFNDNKNLPNMLEFDVRKDFGFTECLKPRNIRSISIIPASKDAWSLTSIVTLARDSFGKATLISLNVHINFTVDLDKRGTLHLTLTQKD